MDIQLKCGVITSFCVIEVDEEEDVGPDVVFRADVVLKTLIMKSIRQVSSGNNEQPWRMKNVQGSWFDLADCQQQHSQTSLGSRPHILICTHACLKESQVVAPRNTPETCTVHRWLPLHVYAMHLDSQVISIGKKFTESVRCNEMSH